MNTGQGQLDWRSMDALVCDFDGVLTDNHVYVGEDGSESVRCNRSDGLAFDALRRLGLPVRILSTERNPIVIARAEKLRLKAVHGVESKRRELARMAEDESWSLDHVLYVGNDLNDLPAMRICGHRACPSDAHPAVMAEATLCTDAAGGEGVVRELVEATLGVDIAEVLYAEQSQ